MSDNTLTKALRTIAAILAPAATSARTASVRPRRPCATPIYITFAYAVRCGRSGGCAGWCVATYNHSARVGFCVQKQKFAKAGLTEESDPAAEHCRVYIQLKLINQVGRKQC